LHAEQRNTIAQFVAQEFRLQAQEMSVPPKVLEFVCGPWAHAVAESQLRCTDGRTDPQGFQAVVADLYWSVQPSKASRHRRRLVQLIPGMLTRLRQGLALIDLPSERITDFFAELIEFHELALEGGRQTAAARQAAQQTGVDEAGMGDDVVSEFDAAAIAASRQQLQALYASGAGPDARAGDEDIDSAFVDFPSSRQDLSDAQDGVWLAQREVSEAGFVNPASNMPGHAQASSAAALASQIKPLSPEATLSIPIGSWVELMLDDAWVRAQLTWASPMRTLFMFVSGGGQAH